MGLSTNKIRFVPRADGGVTAFAIGRDVYKLELPASGADPAFKPSESGYIAARCPARLNPIP